ncbi:hypothetical protein OFM13_31885, partial [Escherichia coli]|nr:hypothetical protein [Escherichia coli]
DNLVNPGALCIGATHDGQGSGSFIGHIYAVLVWRTTASPNADVLTFDRSVRTYYGYGPPIEVAPVIQAGQSLPPVAASAPVDTLV